MVVSRSHFNRLTLTSHQYIRYGRLGERLTFIPFCPFLSPFSPFCPLFSFSAVSRSRCKGPHFVIQWPNAFTFTAAVRLQVRRGGGGGLQFLRSFTRSLHNTLASAPSQAVCLTISALVCKHGVRTQTHKHTGRRETAHILQLNETSLNPGRKWIQLYLRNWVNTKVSFS